MDDITKPPTIEEAAGSTRADLVAVQATLNQIEHILKPINQGGMGSIFRIFPAYGNRNVANQSHEVQTLRKELTKLSNQQLKIVFEQVSEKVQEQQRNVEALGGQKLADKLNMADSPRIPLEKGDISYTVQTIQRTQHSLDDILYLNQIYKSICTEITRRHEEGKSVNVFGEKFKAGDTCILFKDESDIELIPAGTEVQLTGKYNSELWFCNGQVNGLNRFLLVYETNLKFQK